METFRKYAFTFFFLLKWKSTQWTSQQKESLSFTLKQQMLPLTLGFKGKSILVYMSWISWICQYEGSSWEWVVLKVYEWLKKKLVCTAVVKEMVILFSPSSLWYSLKNYFYYFVFFPNFNWNDPSYRCHSLWSCIWYRASWWRCL